MIFFLLIISAAILVNCGTYDEVRFPVSALRKELHAIESYHKNVGKKLDAYIHWPGDVVYTVTTHDERYLKLAGTFTIKKKFLQKMHMANTPSYNGLFYKDAVFYLINEQDMKFALGEDTQLSFKPKDTNTQLSTDSYLKITYRSIDEIKTAIKQFCDDHQNYLESFSDLRPATYLATWDNPTSQFLEYTSSYVDQAVVDGRLIALVGKVKNNILRISAISEPDSMVLNPWNQELSFHDNQKVSPGLVDRVVGVSMGTVGFLVEVQGNDIKLLSSGDVFFENPSKHTVSMGDFLKKTKRVEPMVCVPAASECESGRPTEAKFQIRAHVLTKKSNYQDAEQKILNQECPFLIEFEADGADFWFGDTAKSQLCTDDEKLWAADNGQSSYDPNQVISLVNPAAANNN